MGVKHLEQFVKRYENYGFNDYMMDPTTSFLHLGGVKVKYHIQCKNGNTFSIQASEMHYCTPQSDTGPWTHYEVGYGLDVASHKLLEPYQQKFLGPSQDVYEYVPEAVIEELLRMNGGVDWKDRLLTIEYAPTKEEIN